MVETGIVMTTRGDVCCKGKCHMW